MLPCLPNKYCPDFPQLDFYKIPSLRDTFILSTRYEISGIPLVSAQMTCKSEDSQIITATVRLIWSFLRYIGPLRAPRADPGLPRASLCLRRPSGGIPSECLLRPLRTKPLVWDTSAESADPVDPVPEPGLGPSLPHAPGARMTVV